MTGHVVAELGSSGRAGRRAVVPRPGDGACFPLDDVQGGGEPRDLRRQDGGTEDRRPGFVAEILDGKRGRRQGMTRRPTKGFDSPATRIDTRFSPQRATSPSPAGRPPQACAIHRRSSREPVSVRGGGSDRGSGTRRRACVDRVDRDDARPMTPESAPPMVDVVCAGSLCVGACAVRPPATARHGLTCSRLDRRRRIGDLLDHALARGEARLAKDGVLRLPEPCEAPLEVTLRFRGNWV